MKYTRLSKEQLENLHVEFAHFLASQSIDKAEWEQLKKEKPHVAEQEIDVFSELIWEGALSKAKFAENWAPNHLFLFEVNEKQMNSIILKTNDATINFQTKEGFLWLQENLFSDKVDIIRGTKTFIDRNTAFFELVQQGAVLSEGKFYLQILKLI